MNSSVDLGTTPRVQSLEWSKVATILHRIVAKFHPFEPLTRHAQKLEEFLWVNWSVLTNPSKLRIYRMFTQCLERADPSRVTAQEFIKQIPTPLFMIALLEKGECDAWKIHIPRETILEVLRNIVKLAPTNQRFIEWFATLSNSRLLSGWDALPPLDQLKVLKTAIQTRKEVLQAQERNLNRKSRGVASLPSLPTSTELLAGVSSNRNARYPTRKKKHVASIYVATRRDSTLKDLAALSALPGQVDFQTQTAPSASAWTAGAQHEPSPHVLNSQAPSTYPQRQRQFEDLGQMELPNVANTSYFNSSLMPPPPLPGRQSPLHQLPPSHHSSPYQPPITPFDQSYLDESPYSRYVPPLHFSHAYHPLNRRRGNVGQDQQGLEPSRAFDKSLSDRGLSYPPANDFEQYDNRLQQMPSASSNSSYGGYHDQSFANGDRGSQSIQHGQGTGHSGYPAVFSGHTGSLNIPPHH
ncbi:hypothetical protein JCM5353_000516 [Sporobolomyces roseus]